MWNPKFFYYPGKILLHRCNFVILCPGLIEIITRGNKVHFRHRRSGVVPGKRDYLLIACNASDFKRLSCNHPEI